MSAHDDRRPLNAADLVLAAAIAPVVMLLLFTGLVLGVALGGVGGELVDPAFIAYVVLPPLTTALRARSRRFSLDGTCLLLVVTVFAMAATFGLLVATLGYVYGLLMAGFD
jgi:hypothetical protein